jgi:sec-independent protein translocase protein TatA
VEEKEMNVALAFFGNLGPTELIIILVILLLIFGGTRLPQLASGLGKSIKSFKKGMAEAEDDVALDDKRRPESLREGSSDLDRSRLTSENSTVNRNR